MIIQRGGKSTYPAQANRTINPQWETVPVFFLFHQFQFQFLVLVYKDSKWA
jgi:hypothetical protein